MAALDRLRAAAALASALVALGTVGVLAGGPTFDVVSVKPNKAVDAVRGGTLQPGHFAQTGVTLLEMVRNAYPGQVVGGPGWINSDRFDVDARGSFEMTGYLPGADGSAPVVYLMLRAMLEDRFKLHVHNETREAPVYALELGRSDRTFGPALHAADVDCRAIMAAIASGQPRPGPAPRPGQMPPCASRTSVGHIVSSGVSMRSLADALSRFVNLPVLDRTGLSGDFVLELQWTPDRTLPPPEAQDAAATHAPDDLPSIFTALQEQLGLKLERTRGPVDVVVIDHAEPPIPN
jgi:uncharacterized protein (TIGR03435 family)